VHDPAHDLGVGVDVGRRDVGRRSDDLLHLLHKANGDLEQVPLGHRAGIAVDTALGAAIGNLDNGCLPGHEVGQRRGVIFIHRRVVAESSLHRAAGHVVLHPIAVVELELSVLPFDSDLHPHTAAGCQQDVPNFVG